MLIYNFFIHFFTHSAENTYSLLYRFSARVQVICVNTFTYPSLVKKKFHAKIKFDLNDIDGVKQHHYDRNVVNALEAML